MEISQFASLVNILILLVTYLIIQPLKASITNLTKSVDHLSAVLDKTNADVGILQQQVARLDTSDKSAHKRLNELSVRVDHIEDRCGKVRQA